MRVLVAGATGAIATPLLPRLRDAGHEVVALARFSSPEAAARIPEPERVRVDALDREAVLRATGDARPDVVVNLLTAIPHELNPRRAVAELAPTNRLRREGTRNLVDAARAAGARVVSESVAFMYAPAGDGRVVGEDTPLWLGVPGKYRPIVEAVAELERLTLDADGTVLRFGWLYGPGTGIARDGAIVETVRRGKLPLVGRAGGMWSFVHVDDAASAVLKAVEQPQPGVFNVVDDEPAEVATWVPEVASMVGAPAPKRVPELAARLLAGWWGTMTMTRLRGASNRRAREQLGWLPRYASWRDGMRAELASPPVAAST